MMAWLSLLSTATAADQPAGESNDASRVVHAVLNGLEIDIDSGSGNILKLSYPGAGRPSRNDSREGENPGSCLSAERFRAFPLGLKVLDQRESGKDRRRGDDHLGIAWREPAFEFPGKVSAVVKLLADPDGRSVVMKCTIQNQSQRAIPQVLFPDLYGFLPIAGKSETRLRSGGFVRSPFQDLKRPENGAILSPTRAEAAMRNSTSKSIYDGTMLMRWFDLRQPAAADWVVGSVLGLRAGRRRRRAAVQNPHGIGRVRDEAPPDVDAQPEHSNPARLGTAASTS